MVHMPHHRPDTAWPIAVASHKAYVAPNRPGRPGSARRARTQGSHRAQGGCGGVATTSEMVAEVGRVW
jgi:hypothetical protein